MGCGLLCLCLEVAACPGASRPRWLVDPRVKPSSAVGVLLVANDLASYVLDAISLPLT
jgi:hypothetical protein